MSIYEMPKEELELLSYKEITVKLLEEKGAMKTQELFREIVNLLELSEKIYENKIGDYYTSLTIDKRFISLSSGNWDLRSRHSSDKIIIPVEEEDDDDELEILKDEIDEMDDDELEDLYDDQDDSLDQDAENELKDLVIIDEDELELNE
ncbi:MAG: DNA-directed RNA polymerase subunit delta [Tenericutes bacterium]|jgi:DNA-directed RNA polymerase subunit delta|nr:DNA-directed RNA polymerase subunit delta [Mycoplasmatota bacterium]